MVVNKPQKTTYGIASVPAEPDPGGSRALMAVNEKAKRSGAPKKLRKDNK